MEFESLRDDVVESCCLRTRKLGSWRGPDSRGLLCTSKVELGWGLRCPEGWPCCLSKHAQQVGHTALGQARSAVTCPPHPSQSYLRPVWALSPAADMWPLERLGGGQGGGWASFSGCDDVGDDDSGDVTQGLGRLLSCMRLFPRAVAPEACC